MSDPHPTPQEALDLLLAGNHRWVSGNVSRPHQSSDRRQALAEGQAPYATIFSCTDSRVPPELVFDSGLGDLFVVRTAGSTVDELVLGSIEYALRALATPLIVVLGHSSCGAVQATIAALQSGDPAPGHIASIVEGLEPAYEVAAQQPGDLPDSMMRAQTTLTVELLRNDRPLREQIEAGTLMVVGGRYDLASGQVDIIA